jgi:hypothetical protein
VKRRFAQLAPHEDKLYAIADDGSAWRLLGDPLNASWTKLPDLPHAEREPALSPLPEPEKPAKSNLARYKALS